VGLLGIDAGTSVVKAVLFDDDWSVVRTAEVPVVVDRPHPGWAEQDPAAVVAAAYEVVRRATTGPGPQVDVLAVTGQGDG
jgi:erythritol kinase